VLAGFSLGGGLAAWLALSGRIEARGLIVVAPFEQTLPQALQFVLGDSRLS
jgi:pimeloyl-ACP methyl ester carboxylesterase